MRHPVFHNVRRAAGRYPAAFIGVSILLLVVIGSVPRRPASPLIKLPGTQVGSVEPAETVAVCRQCHFSENSGRPVTLAREWAGSMMAHSARDPVFYAALAVTNKYQQTAGEFCIRCHTPMGWLAGHSEDFTGQSITGTDFDGIQCSYCHRAVDPLNPDSSVPPMDIPVPGYGNGMHALQHDYLPRRGPLTDADPIHAVLYDPFQKSSDFCGVCHDVSNPFRARDRLTQPPYEYSPLERTYSEWAMSSYATMGDSGTCQYCHMPPAPGYVCIYPSAPYRTSIPAHDLTGGNSFVPQMIPDFYPNMDTTALQQGRERAMACLRRAADLQLESSGSGDSVTATVRITNLTGHKLPTGYPDGRRMWIHLVARDNSGQIVFESGAYNPDSATLIRDPQLKVYEAIQGLTDTTAAKFGLAPGPSLQFFLNDTILFDNRIPPKGYTYEAFSWRQAEPVGVTYPDDQYWDITVYRLPPTAVQVTATLLYQTISREYIDFLHDENVGNVADWNGWGSKLRTAWQAHGKSEPVLMDSATSAVSGVDPAGGRPAAFGLRQNYPNPFNPVTRISFVIGHSSLVTLKVYDLLGREVAILVNEPKPPGEYDVEWDATGRPSGVYYCRLQAGSYVSTRKLVLLR